MSEHYNHHEHDPFEGPIEAGKTSALPAKNPEPAPDEIKPDLFVVRCPDIDVQPKSVVLPKFVFSGNIGYKEKGMLLVSYDSDHSTGVYAKVLKAAQPPGFKKFEIDFLNEDEEVLSTWKFMNPRVHAVDFGYVAEQRVEPGEFVIEIDYKHLEVDGVYL